MILGIGNQKRAAVDSICTHNGVCLGAVALVHHSTPSGRRRGQVEAEAKNQKTPKCTLDTQKSKAKSLSGP